MLKQLRIKFVAINMGIVLAMLLVIFGLVYQFTSQKLNAQTDTILFTLSQSVKQPQPMLRQQNIGLPYIVIKITDRGEIFASGVTGYDLSDEAFVDELICFVRADGKSRGTLEQYHLRYVCSADRFGEQIAMVDISSHTNTLRDLIATSITIGAAGLLAFFFMSIMLAKWAVKPVDRAWEQQRQFVSDASHELKTPLTVIMSNSELLMYPECDDANRIRYAENIQVMSKQMRRLTEGLLELARVDNGQVEKHLSILNFSDLISDAVLPFEPLYYEDDLSLQTVIEADITVNGNEQYLRQMIDILLENAHKYSTPGVVTVTLKRMARNQCLLTVSNPGNPIAQVELNRIFDRFYRSDKARSDPGSFGLGLAIAKSIVLEHHGRIWAQSNQSGNCFYVLLPVS